MTIMQSEKLKHGQQEKGFRNFHENFNLNVTSQELEQQPDLQCELLENRYSQYSVLSRTMVTHVDSHSGEAQQQGEEVSQTKTFEGCVDHLLILAQSAEIVAQSEDIVAGMHRNNQNKDQECSQSLLDILSVVSHGSSQRCGFCYEVTRPRLTQIRKQARCKYLILDQERAKDNHCKQMQGKTIRLNQLKHQARCKSKHNLSPQMITGPKNEQPKGRILRFSQMKHQARSKGKYTIKDGTEEHMDESLHHIGFKDNNEKVIARQFVKKNICQVVRWDIENLKEPHRTARRLMAFQNKKPRNQLRKECKRNYANTRLQAMTSLIGFTSMNNSQWLSNSATLLKDHDVISCTQELPETSACTRKLKANIGSEKIQPYLRSNESSAFRSKSLQHIPNRLLAQNNLLSFTRLPNNIIQQCDANVGWMPYMHHMHLKEYHRVVACEQGAERIEEKRALKKRQKNSKFSALAISEAQKEFIPVKRLRLTQLRREARLGNQ